MYKIILTLLLAIITVPVFAKSIWIDAAIGSPYPNENSIPPSEHSLLAPQLQPESKPKYLGKVLGQFIVIYNNGRPDSILNKNYIKCMLPERDKKQLEKGFQTEIIIDDNSSIHVPINIIELEKFLCN